MAKKSARRRRRIVRLLGLAFAALVLAAGWGGWQFAVHRHLPAVAANPDDLAETRMRLRGVLRADPGNVRAAVKLGQVQLALGDPVAAEHTLRGARAREATVREATVREATARDAHADAINLLLAQALLAQRRPGDLLREFPPAGPPPMQAAMLVLRAEALMALGDRAGAALLARDAAARAPGLVDAPVVLGRNALSGGDVETAMRQAARALALDPHSPQALLLKGQIYAATGDPARALEALDAVLALQPGLVPARLARARLRLRGGDLARAGEDIDAATARDPANVEALYLRAARLSRLGQDAEADAALMRLGEDVGRFPRGLYVLALVKSRRHQPEQAWEAVTRQLRRYPGDAEALALFADLAGQLAATSHPDALLALAGLDIEAGRLGDAETHLRAVLAQRPDEPMALNNLAVVYQQRGDPRALATARRAYAAQPSSQAADTLGWILVGENRDGQSRDGQNRDGQNDRPEGLALLRAAAAARPEAAIPRQHLAAALAARDTAAMEPRRSP